MYEQHYGFTGRPFQLTPDPEFYFESASHAKAMSYLSYGLNQGEGFIVITGDVGVGKSTLVAHLMERVDPTALTVGQIVTSALDADEIIHVVAQSFGLVVEGKDKAGALGAIERFLQDEARDGRRCLLVVDECQNLELPALEELRMLSNFQLDATPLLQSLLVGQSEFRRTLAHHSDLDQLRQRIIASHHLEALSLEEVEGYVVHRLERVGWEHQPELGEGLKPALFEATQGIARRVNQVMNRMLLLGAIESRDTLSLEMLEAVRKEMEIDPKPVATMAKSRPEPVEPEPEPVEMITTDLANVPITEFQIESSPAENAQDPDTAEAIERLEARLEEQERSFRHVLTMLIEWLEDGSHSKAA
ncbi:MAG: AAA family ATPase [Pseudomonadota bacterium]